MRKKIVAGNWKMNKTHSEALELLNEIENQLSHDPVNDVIKIVCPPFVYLSEIAPKVKYLKTGAQNCSSELSGAFTGEVSAAMLSSTGVQYVIVGHSERRAYYNETSEVLVRKTAQALSNKLTPIFCIGEVLAERNSGKHQDVIREQLTQGLFQLSAEQMKAVVIAYEPVWAIGTGVTATSAQAQEMHAFIRSVVALKYGNDIAEGISILYGGSCNAQNAKELFSCKDVDGGLIGGASLKAVDFIKIIQSF